MAFGAFAPLPLRLGGDAKTGWRASEHARVAADLVAIGRTSRLGFLAGRLSTTPTQVTGAWMQWGTGTPAYPQIVKIGTGQARLTFPVAPDDELEEPHTLLIRSAKGALMGSLPRRVYTQILSPNVVDVFVYDQSTASLEDDDFFLVLGGRWLGRRTIGVYGGAKDKIDSHTEGDVPYAWTWYQQFTAALGPGFSEQSTKLVHCRKLAAARSEQARTRAAERARCNSIPLTSDELLGKWVEVSGAVVTEFDDKHTVRQRVGAHFATIGGNDAVSLSDAVRELLGPLFSRITRAHGPTLSSPSALTYWPTVNPGPGDQDLGGGAWSSERSKVVVELTRDAQNPEERILLDVHLRRLLEDRIPAWATYDWLVP